MMEENTKTGSSVSPGMLVVGLVVVMFVVSAVALYMVVTYWSPFGARTGMPARRSAGAGESIEGAEVERAAPTEAQRAALEGGTPVAWDGYGLAWTVPAGWRERASGPGELVWADEAGAASLSASATPMPESLAAGAGLNAIYQEAVDRRRDGMYTEVRLLELDGLRGVTFLEGPPADAAAGRSVHWQAYRSGDGRAELVNLVLSAPAATFADSADTLYAILYSTRVSD